MTSPYLLDSGLLAGIPSMTGLLGNQPPSPVQTPDAHANNIPGSISTLLPSPSAQIAAGVAAPGPSSQAQALMAPAPTPQAPPQIVWPPHNPKRGLLHRVADALESGLLAPVHALDNLAVGPAPIGFQGRLTPEQLKAARPSFLDALFGGNGQTSAWDRNAANLAAGQLYQQRQQLFDQIGPPENGDIANSPAWITKALPWAIKNGDFEMAKTLAPLYNELLRPQAGAQTPGKLFINPDTHELQTFSTRAGTVIPKPWIPYNENKSGDSEIWSTPDLSKSISVPKGKTPFDVPGVQHPEQFMEGASARAVYAQTHTDSRFNTQTGRLSATAFNNDPDIKMITKQAAIAHQFKTIIGEARKGNAVASNSLISQMAALLDPGLQLRLGTIYYLKELDPSIEGKLSTWASRLKNGTWPKYQLDELDQLVNEVQDANKRVYTERRTDFLQGVPGAAPWTPSEKVYFSQPTAATAGGGNAFSDLIPGKP